MFVVFLYKCCNFTLMIFVYLHINVCCVLYTNFYIIFTLMFIAFLETNDGCDFFTNVYYISLQCLFLFFALMVNIFIH